MDQEIFDKIKEASKHVNIAPTDAVWDKLECRLDADTQSIRPSTKRVKLFDFRKWSIAATIVILVGAYGVFNHLGNQKGTFTSAIQLEDLHTLEVNPRFNVAPIGESSTIPTIHSLRTNYKVINEGAVNKKLMKRSNMKGGRVEYGLG